MFHNIYTACKKNITTGILVLLLISFLINFISSAWSRVFFFIASYASIVAVIINYKAKPSKELIVITVAFILIGLNKYLWFLYEYVDNPDYNKYNPYFNTGQRLILGGIISYALFSTINAFAISKAKIIEAAIIAAFAIATVIGLYQAFHFSGRVDFYLGFATDSAYMYAALSICSVILLQNHKHFLFKIASVIILLISLFLIFKTGTRNILVSYPVIIIISLLAWRKQNIKNVLACLIVLLAALSIGYNDYIKPKVVATTNEIQNYKANHGNKLGSLTARLAMWKLGYEAFKNDPLSMSLEQREEFFNETVNSTKQDKAALSFVNVHLHNEIIETASLQGFPGVAVLIITYILLLTSAIRTRNNALLSVVLVVMAVGLSDVVFISREQTIFFATLITLIALHKSITQRDEIANTN